VRARGRLEQALDDLPDVSVRYVTPDLLEPGHEQPPLIVLIERHREVSPVRFGDDGSKALAMQSEHLAFSSGVQNLRDNLRNR
jgi:hypothetical protein